MIRLFLSMLYRHWMDRRTDRRKELVKQYGALSCICMLTRSKKIHPPLQQFYSNQSHDVKMKIVWLTTSYICRTARELCWKEQVNVTKSRETEVTRSNIVSLRSTVLVLWIQQAWHMFPVAEYFYYCSTLCVSAVFAVSRCLYVFLSVGLSRSCIAGYPDG